MAHRFDCVGPPLNISGLVRLLIYRFLVHGCSVPTVYFAPPATAQYLEESCRVRATIRSGFVPSLTSFIRLGQTRVVRLFVIYYHPTATEGIDYLT